MNDVLVVEDDDGIREILATTLREAGFTVAEATNGATALQTLMLDELPCVILLDLIMPVMDGQEFCMRKQSDPRLAKLPVILLSADRTALTGARRLPIQEAIEKPFDLDSLIKTVERYCRRARVANGRKMGREDDLWKQLTKMAMRLYNDADRGAVDAKQIVDTTLRAFAGVPHVEENRQRLEQFIRDISDGETTAKRH